MRKFIVSLVLLWAGSAQAGHVLGGEIYWDCAGNGDYIFHLVLKTDCTMILPTGGQTITGPFGAIYCPWDTVIGTQQTNTCASNCIQETYHGISQPVQLSGTPPAAGWTFSWASCCRDYEQNVTSTAAIYIASTMYPYTPPGASAPLPADSCYNNPPRFANSGAMVHCDGPYSYNHGIYDVERDSIFVNFAPPMVSSTTAIGFSSGYSFDQPYPDFTENSLNGAVSIDSLSGLVSMDFYDASPGYYISAYRLREYRDGQLTAEITRDFPLVVLDSAACSAGASNNRPNLNLVTNNQLNMSQTGTVYTLVAQQGDTVDLDILITDFDFNANGTPQTICLNAQSQHINPANYTLDSACASGNCATITPNGAGGFCQTISGSYKFQWIPDCALLNSTGLGPEAFRFQITVSDNACPVPKSRQATIMVLMYPPLQIAPVLTMDSVNTLGRVDLSWSKAQIAPGASFQAYKLYMRPLNGVYSLIDSITDIDSTQASYTGLPFPCEIYLDATAGSCPQSSPPSNVINTDVAIGLADYQAGELKFDLSPNPAKDYLYLQLQDQNPLQDARLSVYDIRGRLLRTYTLGTATKWKIELKEAPGTYLFKLSGDQAFGIKKLIIQ